MKSSGKIYLWRGAIGGLTGGVVAEIIPTIIQAGPRVNWIFILFAVLLNGALSVIIGALIGAIIWKSPKWAGYDRDGSDRLKMSAQRVSSRPVECR